MKVIAIILSILGLIIFAVLYGILSNKVPDHMVLDCSVGSECVERTLEYRLEDCEPVPWYIKNEPDCKRTRKNIDEIYYIADPATYVPFPFTNEKFKVELIDVELTQPWDISFLPDGSMLITERTGRLVYIKDSKLKLIHKFEPVVLAETGLCGLAIDPEFEKNQYIYVYITYAFDNSNPEFMIDEHNPDYNRKRRVLNKIIRFKFVNNSLTDEHVLLDKIPGTSWHVGGRLEFGPDNKLYATTGDAEEPQLAQYGTFLGGKILRMNTDGSIPNDNPFNNSYVYSMGHRNPQGIAWQPSTGEMYAVEHGDIRYDELNRIIAGTNYGWGSFKCDEKIRYLNFPPNGKTKDPVYCSKQWTMAPSGMEFVSDKNSPWYNSLFLAMLRGKHLHRFKLTGDKVDLSEIFFVAAGKDYDSPKIKNKLSQRLRDVEYHDGSLYVIGDYSGLVKITPITE